MISRRLVAASALCLALLNACSDAGDLSLRDTTRIADTADPQGPYLVSAVAIDDVAVDRVVLNYAIDGGAPVAVAMKQVRAGHYEAGIPGQPLGSRVSVWVRAIDNEGNEALEPDDAPGRQFAFSVLEARQPDLGDTSTDTDDFPDVDIDIPRDVPDARDTTGPDVDPDAPDPVTDCEVRFAFPIDGQLLGVEVEAGQAREPAADATAAEAPVAAGRAGRERGGLAGARARVAG